MQNRQNRRYASGEYLKADASVRNLFETQPPSGAAFELERSGPISGPQEAPPPSSREMDRNDFNFSNAPPMALELERERSVIRAVPPPPLSTDTAKAALVATKTQGVIEAFAGFGRPPENVFQTPGYALRVFGRRRELARELAYARRGRSPDVALFEAAMGAYDVSAAKAGATILGALVFAFVALSFAALVWI